MPLVEIIDALELFNEINDAKTIICTKNGERKSVSLCKSKNRSANCLNYAPQLNPLSPYEGVCIWLKNGFPR